MSGRVIIETDLQSGILTWIFQHILEHRCFRDLQLQLQTMTTSSLPAPAPSATAAAVIVALSIFTITTTTIQAAASPHIILIIADDLGWSDVEWMDPDMVTPNLNTLKGEGVDLTSAYMQALCSPSRAAVLSGKYPFKMGMQHATLKAINNGTMPLGLKLLPERLKDLGYSTHLVGKWHLGFCSWDMTPTFRGFDTFYGIYLGQGTVESEMWTVSIWRVLLRNHSFQSPVVCALNQ